MRFLLCPYPPMACRKGTITRITNRMKQARHWRQRDQRGPQAPSRAAPQSEAPPDLGASERAESLQKKMAVGSPQPPRAGTEITRSWINPEARNAASVPTAVPSASEGAKDQRVEQLPEAEIPTLARNSPSECDRSGRRMMGSRQFPRAAMR